MGSPERPRAAVGAKANGALAGLARKDWARESACRASFGSAAAPVAARPSYAAASNTLCDNATSSPGLGTAIRIAVSATKWSQMVSAVTPESGVASVVPSKLAEAVVPLRATVGANVGTGGGSGYCTKTRLNESRPPYPTQLDDALAVDTNCFAAFAFGNARMLSLTTTRPSVVPRSTPFPDGGPFADAASTSAAFGHACFNASL